MFMLFFRFENEFRYPNESTDYQTEGLLIGLARRETNMNSHADHHCLTRTQFFGCFTQEKGRVAGIASDQSSRLLHDSVDPFGS